MVSEGEALAREMNVKVRDAESSASQRTRSSQATGDVEIKDLVGQGIWKTLAEKAKPLLMMVMKHIDASSVLRSPFSGSRDDELRDFYTQI